MARISGATRPKRTRKSRVFATMLVIAGGLSGCSWLPDYANPIEWYRSATGISKYDDTGQERNAQNLASGGKEPYPNLGTVPPVPDRAMSGVDREKLVEGLVADRSHAKYSEEALRAGEAVPPLPGQAPPIAMREVPASAAGAASPPAKTANNNPRHTPPERGSEAPPQESPLESPTVHSEPKGEAPLAAPPPPPGVPGHQAPPPPQQQAAVTPPLPEFVPAPAAPQPTVMRTPGSKNAAISVAVAEIAFAGGGSTMSADDNRHLANAAKLHQQHGGVLRVVGYGQRGSGANAAQQELASFSQALDRANAVAAALGKLGVPQKDIVTQAAPASTPGEQGVAVFLEY